MTRRILPTVCCLRRLPLFASILIACCLVSTPVALAADYYPPRVSHVDGNAAYIPVGKVNWEELAINIPLLNGDRVFAQRDSRIEIELGDANFLRLADETDLTFQEALEKEIQLNLDVGVLILRLNKSRRIRIQTAHGTVEVKKKGLYRIGVDESGQMQVIVRKGKAEIESAGGKQKLGDGEEIVLGARYQGPMQVSQDSFQDEFDRWSDRRDAGYMSSSSVAYVGGTYHPGVYDLDRYGYWTSYPGYGRVWLPHVSVGWSPYRSGFWFNFGFGFGWTWISHEPWGWLPYHYGNWHYYSPHRRWCWIPGSFNRWHPARVNFYHGGGYVGWAPTPHRFANNNSVTVINNNTIVNRPDRAGLSVVRQEDFGRRPGSPNRSTGASREIAENFRPGLPENLPNPQRGGVRQAFSGGEQLTGRATKTDLNLNRLAPQTGRGSDAVRTVSGPTAVTRGGGPSSRTVTGTSRILRSGGETRSVRTSSPAVVTLPSRSDSSALSRTERNFKVNRSTTTDQTRVGTAARTSSNPPAPKVLTKTTSNREIQRISRPSGGSAAPATSRLSVQGRSRTAREIPVPSASASRNTTQLGSGPSRSATVQPTQTSRRTLSTGQSYKPSVTSSPSRSVRSPGSSSRYSSPSRPSGSYSRPAAPTRSGSSGRTSAPSRSRSSSRSSGRSGRN